MTVNPIKDAIAGVISPIVDGFLQFIPDKNERARAKEQLEAQMLGAVTSVVQGQLEVNKKEAEHASVFVAGWRPAIGWICGAGLAWNFVGQPLVEWGAILSGYDVRSPQLEMFELTSILMGMLGMGGLRTYEKRLGVARETIKPKKGGDDD